jgi:hypothetical protein
MMTRPLIEIRGGAGWLDIGSYGRHGPGKPDRLSPAHVAFISRTVRRSPEVMIKMLKTGGSDLGAVVRHLSYIDRDGDLTIETDEGEPLKGKGAAAALIEDWDLQLDAKRPTTADHKPPQNVLAAVKGFAREEFGAKHRYAMVLHTDEPHPHVHVVVKAMGYDGKRLNPRKATLREWRRQFARHLREHSVAANATDRAVRA